MNIAIVDDEQDQINSLTSLLKEYAAINRLEITLSPFHSGEELLSGYHPYAYTALFLDIYMEGMSGIEAAKKLLLKDRSAIIVFLTSSDEYMPEAFSLHTYDYIPKPANKERIFRVMDDILMRVTEGINDKMLTIKDISYDVSIPYGRILSIRTSKPNYLDIYVISGEEYHARMTFSEAAKTVSQDNRFLLIMRGCLVNMDHIDRIMGGSCIMNDGSVLPVNLRSERELSETFNNYTIDRIRNEHRGRNKRK